MPPTAVTELAARFDAIAFDAADAPDTHQGARCTFDAMCDAFALDTPALRKRADIIRAADTNTQDSAPEAAGLLAMSVGLSRHCKDDEAQLVAAMPLYDALYRWARDGQAETHDWDAEMHQ